MRMKKFLLLIAAVMTAGVSMAQKVTLDFTNAEEEWGMPLKANGVGEEEQQFTNGTYTIKMKAGGSGNLAYYNGDGYLMIGKQGATLTLPAFDFAVGKIVVTGRTGASGATKMNVYVGDEAVSTETTGSAATNTYAIAEGSQAAGTVYTFKINSMHNAQFVKIDIYEVGEEVEEPELEDPTNTMETAYTVAQALALIDKGNQVVDLNKEVYVKGTITEVQEVSLQYKNATYVIADAAGDESTLTIFRGKWFDGEGFTTEDAIKVGDEVIVLGKLMLYGSTYEMAANNKIVSLNGVTTGISSISAAKGEGKAYDLTGRIANKNAKGIVIVNGKKVVK